MNKKFLKWTMWVIIFALIVLGVSLLSLCIGTIRVSLGQVLSFLFKEGDGTAIYSILFQIRLPRIILGFAVGSALSIAGVILQGMFRNPLVEPYTLGISGGAALGVCLNITFKLNRFLTDMSMPLAGFLGGLAVIMLVYFLNARKSVLKMQGLLLTGVMISYICASLVMLIMAIMRIEDLHGIIFWTMGSLEQPNWFFIKTMIVISFLGLIITYIFCKDLNAFALGEEQALHLGVNVEVTKRILFLAASLLTGASVACAGIIGFVGLVIPHCMRIVVGSDHRILIISSFLAGGAFLIASDTIARTVILPLELPVGVITGIIGGGIFIYALCAKKSR